MNQIQLYSVDNSQPLTREQVLKLARMAALTPDEISKRAPIVLRENAYEVHIEREDGEVVSVFKTQDAKFGVLHIESRRYGLANLRTGMPIPEDEPVFILRAKDLCAPAAIDAYCRAVQDHATAVEQHTLESAAAALERFFKFQAAFPGRCKLPS